MKGRPKTIEIQILAILAATPGLRMAGIYERIVGCSQDSAKSVVHRMFKRGDLRCSNKQRNRMYFLATPEYVRPKVDRPKKPTKAKVKAFKPVPIVFAKPKVAEKPKQRGPAYLDGPLIFTNQTRRVVYPSKPDPWKSNTYAA